MKPCCTGHDANSACDGTCLRNGLKQALRNTLNEIDSTAKPTHREALKTPSRHWLSGVMFWAALSIISVVIVYWAYQGAMDGVVW